MMNRFETEHDTFRTVTAGSGTLVYAIASANALRTRWRRGPDGWYATPLAWRAGLHSDSCTCMAPGRLAAKPKGVTRLPFLMSILTMKPLYRAFVKATDRELGGPRRSASWVFARRAWFRVYRDRVECGDWVIPAESVENATLYRSRTLGVPVSVLSITSEGRTWQFGFNPWARVAEHLPFTAREEAVRLGHSAFAIAARIAFVILMLYWLWRG